MAMEDRIQSTIVGKQQFQEEYDLVGIYRNQEMERSFSEYMNPNALRTPLFWNFTIYLLPFKKGMMQLYNAKTN